MIISSARLLNIFRTVFHESFTLFLLFILSFLLSFFPLLLGVLFFHSKLLSLHIVTTTLSAFTIALGIYASGTRSRDLLSYLVSIEIVLVNLFACGLVMGDQNNARSAMYDFGCIIGFAAGLVILKEILDRRRTIKQDVVVLESHHQPDYHNGYQSVAIDENNHNNNDSNPFPPIKL
eukprot:comp11365_c0_seq1/m.14269 comp11365_c0_seq1/g.14269  ORF comp11365_c0_seq1/g.14269 comp11365_c0_seq1/m.14269 type:complete len:177 (-) comp11365_c0_seq1:16-546(-)